MYCMIVEIQEKNGADITPATLRARSGWMLGVVVCSEWGRPLCADKPMRRRGRGQCYLATRCLGNASNPFLYCALATQRRG